ncbi:hypothetical protein GDO86_013583 [Hymenochirus boettgeri]|uniref:Olfactory receptor n=1 Tax=Hymenochirus boettgeri TaxID=247094 RepID=A0A8T2IXC2_9PIPI|nr:hypothetical protein GDO86_013583 [Hymenochirus boettgeri]
MPNWTLGNQTEWTEFTVECLSNAPELQVPMFILFLLIYLIILNGNTTIIVNVAGNSNLHTPMYLLLSSFSLLEIFYTSTILPKLLAMLYTQHKTISVVGCKVQLYFFMVFLCMEFMLLAIMAYDRYVAVCHPLRYHSLISVKLCAKLITAIWIFCILDTLPLIFIIAYFSFCASNHIDHFYCDVTPVLKITCSDTSTLEILIFLNGIFLFLSAFSFTCLSYILIIRVILHIQSSEGRRKAFSTCSSHLTCVVIFYGTIYCLYMRPASNYEPGKDKFLSLLYIVLVPMLNPFIYIFSTLY